MLESFYKQGSLSALRCLALEKLGREFAPGIPSKRRTERLPNITPKTTNQWTVAVQDHEAARAGRHYDLRLVDPDAGKAHSWAIPKAKLPKPGERLLAVQTFTHTPEYALHFGEKKPQVIGKGYGKGSVRMALKEPTDIIEAHNNLVRFNIYKGKNTQKYLLRRTKNDKWLIMNTTKRASLPEHIKQAEPPPPRGVSCKEWDKILQRGPSVDKELPKSTKKAYHLLGNQSVLTTLGIMTGERR